MMLAQAELPLRRRRARRRSREYIALRRTQPHFANARSIRNALDRARLRQANRLFETASAGPLDAEDLSTDRRRADIRASRVFTHAGRRRRDKAE